MKNVNEIRFTATLQVQERTAEPIQAFATAQNIIRVIAPFDNTWVPYAIFEATADRPIATNTQNILMTRIGEETIGQETFTIYEVPVPKMVQGSAKATKVEFVAAFFDRKTTTVNGTEKTFIGIEYFDTTPTSAALDAIFTEAEEDDYVRVIFEGVGTDWEYDGNSWTDTSDLFESIIQENRSDVVEFVLRKGKESKQPTVPPNNTEAIIEALQTKADTSSVFTKQQSDDRFVNVTGDTMTGTLQFANAAATRLVLGNNNTTTDGAINATTFANGNNSSDAVKFSNFANLFDVTVATPSGGQTWIDTVAAALATKFAGVLTVSQLGDFFARKDGSNSYTSNLNMGGNQITNVGNVDGVDVSAFKQAYDTHTHTISQVDNLQSALDTLTSNVSALGGAFVFRGVIANTTAQVEADTSLLTTRIDVLLERTPQTGDVLKDSEGGEWYYDGAEWRFMGQASIDLTQYYTKSEADGEFAALTHTHVETDITDLDKYTQAQVDTLLNGKAASVHTHVEADITDLDKYTTEEVDGFLANKLDVGVLASNIILYPTSTPADVTNYFKLVTSPDDPDYDAVATDITTVAITGQNILLAQLVSNPGIFIGNPGIINVPVVGQIRKTDSNPDVSARFYFEIYKRDEQGSETLLGTSNETQRVGSIIYEEFNANALLNNGVFTDTDRLVFKFYGNKVSPNNGTYDFKFGGEAPVRILLNVPISTTLQADRVFYNNATSELDAENVQDAIDEVVANLDQSISDTTTALDTKPTIDPITGKIPASVVPLQFDDVIQGYLDDGVFYEDQALENALTGETGKLYIDLTTNKLYRFDGSAYVLIIDAAEITGLNDIPGVVITSPDANQALVFNGTNWVNADIPRSLSALSDTDLSTISTGQVLTYNGTDWVALGIPDKSLNDLTDVVIDTPIANNLLVYNGTNFANQAGSSSLVGLNNVQNFGIATQAEAEAGTVDNKYMTPERTAQAIAELETIYDDSTVTSHIADTTIHFTKASLVKADVGLDNVDNTADANKFVAGVVETRNSDQLSFWQGTQAQYDAIGTKNANTIYLITE